jgi:hypothetical protein
MILSDVSLGAGGLTTAIKAATQSIQNAVATSTGAIKTAAAAQTPTVTEGNPNLKWWLLGAAGLAAIGGGVYYFGFRDRGRRR